MTARTHDASKQMAQAAVRRATSARDELLEWKLRDRRGRETQWRHRQQHSGHPAEVSKAESLQHNTVTIAFPHANYFHLIFGIGK
jgi:hypothetical protein